jgi:hypothetical protein
MTTCKFVEAMSIIHQPWTGEHGLEEQDTYLQALMDNQDTMGDDYPHSTFCDCDECN